MDSSIRPFQACIFDFDGVLVDSEPVHERASRMTLDHFGIAYPRLFPLSPRELSGEAVVLHSIADRLDVPKRDVGAVDLGAEHQPALG